MEIVLLADALEGLRTLEPESVHTCVTSPPYFNLRDYGVAGQIGNEDTPEAFVGKLVEVFREVWRVLRPDGTLWVNIGDSYATRSGKQPPTNTRNSCGHTEKRTPAGYMHKTNHPHTTHYQASVWDVDPLEVTHGSPVGLLWASPDCKHFSKAKGGKPVEKKIRSLAWIVLRWAGTVRPRVIILENVEEFQTWGPVRKGKPVKKLSGQTFHKWLGQLEALGYTVEWRELVAADYGAPTTRKRFFLIARCDGRPIVWPEPTHAPADSPEVKAGLKKPWRSAAEIIDWNLPAPSIFASKEEIRERYGVAAVRPLAKNTMRRVARGVDKFVIKSATPFIVPTGYGEAPGQQPRLHDISRPAWPAPCPAMQTR